MADGVEERSAEHAGAARRRLRDVRLVAIGIGAVLLAWFAVVNLQSVDIRFWLTSARAPLVVVIAIAGFLGAAVLWLVGRSTRRRSSGRDESR